MTLQQVLADLAAGRPVSAADYERLRRLCQKADEAERRGDDSSEADHGASPRGAVKTCRRCGTVTRHIYCPNCGERP